VSELETAGYTVGRVAGLSGVRIRTLHHYDEIGLLSSGGRSAAGYRIYEDPEVDIAKALSSGTRVKILRWLRDPAGSFESVVEDDLTGDGVCVNLIAAKAGVSQPTASRHLAVLKGEGLVETGRVAQLPPTR